MSNELRITYLQLTCNSFPVQYEGTLNNGWKVYGRSRFSRMQVVIYDPKIPSHNVMSGHFILEATVSGNEYGVVTASQLKRQIELFVSMITDWHHLM